MLISCTHRRLVYVRGIRNNICHACIISASARFVGAGLNASFIYEMITTLMSLCPVVAFFSIFATWSDCVCVTVKLSHAVFRGVSCRRIKTRSNGNHSRIFLVYLSMSLFVDYSVFLCSQDRFSGGCVMSYLSGGVIAA